MEDTSTTGFTLGDNDYTVVRYSAPTTRGHWEELLGNLLDCGPENAAAAYEIMFPGGYDPDGTDDVALHVSQPPLRSHR